MALLLFFRVFELLFHACSQHRIRQIGSPHLWKTLWLFIYFIRNVLFIHVIMLIRAGWSLFRPNLQNLQIRAIFVTVGLQFVASTCFVLSNGLGTSSSSYGLWTVTYYALDFICCVIMTLPVSPSIDNVVVSEKIEEKEDKKWVYKRAYESFALALYIYVGFTRLGMFLIRSITSYNMWGLSIALELTIELIFYGVVYSMFWPSERYDYVVLEVREEDHGGNASFADLRQRVAVIGLVSMDSLKENSKGYIGHSTMAKKPIENIKFLISVSVGIMFGFFMGVLIPKLPQIKIGKASVVLDASMIYGRNVSATSIEISRNVSIGNQQISKIWAPSNPRGAERLPPGIMASELDLYQRRLWGLPREDLPITPKYLVTFTVGYKQRFNINKAVKKFSENFTILLFHYDGITTEWDEFEWSKRAIHISARKQTKWWHAKRFLHPDIVASYDYIFIWDEELGVEHFDAEEYIKLVRKHGLEISQPGLEPTKSMPWRMTRKRDHRSQRRNRASVLIHICHRVQHKTPHSTQNLFVSFAYNLKFLPLFTIYTALWRSWLLSSLERLGHCVWHLIQNDLVHGWGLDFALQKCVEPAHEKIGVVDEQWIVQIVPSLGGQGESTNGRAPWQEVRLRCTREWAMFQARMANAERDYHKSMEIDSSYLTT
ncbi:hypothetical protein SASPL_142620 [Salvia splendens]|uniref:GOST seven transmembrane domain-containing protein n=1 Tax=Salvia splendens TaxID=180675 RepID=A0A8X8WL02_SALSN|nr:hypothetical protein SASPL_142620 [Salvia splendens]